MNLSTRFGRIIAHVLPNHSGHPLKATGGGNEIWKKCLLVGEMKYQIISRGSPYLGGMDFPGGGLDDSIDNFRLLK